jgi:hypothetical protein
MLNVPVPEWGEVWNTISPDPLPVTSDQLPSFNLTTPSLTCGSKHFSAFIVLTNLLQCQMSTSPTRLSCSSTKMVKKLVIPHTFSISTNPDVMVVMRDLPFLTCHLIIPVLEHTKSNLTAYPFMLNVEHLHLYLSYWVIQHSHSLNHCQIHPRIPMPLYYHRMI